MSVRLTPNAASDRIDGIVVDAKGRSVLRVAVTAVPEHGRANMAMIKMLAKQWRFPKSSLSLLQGTKDRNKVLSITGDTAARFAYLRAWSQQLIEEI